MAFRKKHGGLQKGDEAQVLRKDTHQMGHEWKHGVQVVLFKYDTADNSWWCRWVGCKSEDDTGECYNDDCIQDVVHSGMTCTGWIVEDDLKVIPPVTDKEVSAAIKSILAVGGA